MKYLNTCTGTFVERPNRFIAYVEVDGKQEKCHVKNTGRCKELLIPGAKVILDRSSDPKRSTKFDLVSVYKGDMLVNIDSQAPNKIVQESYENIDFLKGLSYIRPEFTIDDSRIDIYGEGQGRKVLMEIKGVTLEIDGTALFPDAPTERGLKHVRELQKALGEGYESCIFFLVQMRGPEHFTPNYEMHMEFALEVEKAYMKGVKVLVYDCVVKEDEILLGNRMDIKFKGHS